MPRTPHLLLALSCGACAVVPEGDEWTTPQRPVLSTDTGTTAEGVVEAEIGIGLDRGDAHALPMMIQFGAGPRSELFLALEAVDQERGDDGLTDVFIGARQRFWEAGRDSAGVQLTASIPSGDAALSAGEPAFYGALMGTREFNTSASLTVFAEAGFLPDADGASGRRQMIYALAVGQALPRRFGVFGELALVDLEDAASTSIATVGFTKSLTRSLAFDLGVSVGLDDDAPDTQVHFGLTASLGRPFTR